MNTRKENTPGHRVTQLIALVVVDQDGDEGIPTLRVGAGPAYPMVGSDGPGLVEEFRKVAHDQIAKGRVKIIKLVRFHQMEVIETIS